MNNIIFQNNIKDSEAPLNVIFNRTRSNIKSEKLLSK